MTQLGKALLGIDITFLLLTGSALVSRWEQKRYPPGDDDFDVRTRYILFGKHLRLYLLLLIVVGGIGLIALGVGFLS